MMCIEATREEGATAMETKTEVDNVWKRMNASMDYASMLSIIMQLRSDKFVDLELSRVQRQDLGMKYGLDTKISVTLRK